MLDRSLLLRHSKPYKKGIFYNLLESIRKKCQKKKLDIFFAIWYNATWVFSSKHYL